MFYNFITQDVMSVYFSQILDVITFYLFWYQIQPIVVYFGVILEIYVTLWCYYATAPGTLGYTRHLLGLVSWVRE